MPQVWCLLLRTILLENLPDCRRDVLLSPALRLAPQQLDALPFAAANLMEGQEQVVADALPDSAVLPATQRNSRYLKKQQVATGENNACDIFQ